MFDMNAHSTIQEGAPSTGLKPRRVYDAILTNWVTFYHILFRFIGCIYPYFLSTRKMCILPEKGIVFSDILFRFVRWVHPYDSDYSFGIYVSPNSSYYVCTYLYCKILQILDK